MNEEYSFWCPVRIGIQLGLLPRFECEQEIILTGHLVRGKHLLWGSVQTYLDHSVIQVGMTQQFKT